MKITYINTIKQYQKKWLQHVQWMDTNGLPVQALQYKPKGQRNIGQQRRRWRDQLHLEDQWTGNMPNPSGTWWWWFTKNTTYIYDAQSNKQPNYGGDLGSTTRPKADLWETPRDNVGWILDLHSTGMLHGEERYLFTDISGQTIKCIFKSQARQEWQFVPKVSK
jgi:hypothetical protein